jgi:hypothetical protein
MATGSLVPDCFKCKNFLNLAEGKGWVCKAFPDGILPEILVSKVLHDHPIEGDHGIQFELLERNVDESEDEILNNQLEDFNDNNIYDPDATLEASAFDEKKEPHGVPKKFSKKLVLYQSQSPIPSKTCSACYMFTSPHSCAIVGGYINPEGFCVNWLDSVK